MRASLLMRDPEIQSVSMRLLVGIASSIERESAKRYAGLAEIMERRGEAATAAAFRVMLEEERHHVDDVARWAAGLGEQVPEPGSFDWQLPADLSGSWDEISGSALLTPYRAFAIAVANEQRAFALYSYLAARATDPRVRAQAERLGIEELRHAAVMRRWRREAWHRERRATRATPLPAAGAVASAEALQALLAKHEATIAQAAAEASQNRPFKDMFDAWMADGVARKDGNAELRRSFEKDVLPVLGDKPVRSITEHDLRKVLRTMVARGVNRMSVRVHQDLVQLFA